MIKTKNIILILLILGLGVLEYYLYTLGNDIFIYSNLYIIPFICNIFLIRKGLKNKNDIDSINLAKFMFFLNFIPIYNIVALLFTLIIIGSDLFKGVINIKKILFVKDDK